MPRRILLSLALVLLVHAAPARAYECEPLPPGAWTSEACPYSEAVTFGGPAPGRVHAAGDVSVAPDGRIAVADGGAHRAIVLAADGTPGLVLGGSYVVGANAVAFAPDGSLYVAEDGRIHRHAADGREIATITEGLSGNGHVRLHDLAVDANGRVYGAGYDGILVWSPQGRLERTIARSAYVIAAGGNGRLFAADAAAGKVHELTATGGPVRTFNGENAAFGTDGRLYLGRGDDFHVFDASGAHVETIARPDGFGGSFQIAAGPTAIYAVSHEHSQSDQVTAMKLDGNPLAPLGREAGKGLNAPAALAVEPGGRSFVADTRNRRLVELSPTGEMVRTVRTYPPPAGQPVGVALGPDGELVVATDTGVVERLGRDGAVRATWRIGEHQGIHAVEVAPGGDVLVRDGATLRRYTPLGILVRSFPVAAEGSSSGHGFAVGPDGSIYSATESGIRKSSPTGALVTTYAVSSPEGVALDAGGNIYVATQRGIQVLTPDGRPALSWGANGTTAGRMQLPWDIDADAQGRVFVADKGGHRVFRFTLKPPATASAPAQPLSQGPAGPLNRVTMRVLRSALATRRGEIRLRLWCASDCSGTAELRAGGRRAGQARFRTRAGQTLTVRVRLTKTARRRLVRTRRLRITVLTSIAGGSEARETLTLRLRRRR